MKPRLSEDWLAVVVGGVILAASLAAVLVAGDGSNPLVAWLGAPSSWTASPVDGLGDVAGLVGSLLAMAVLFGIALRWSADESVAHFARAFAVLFLVALLALLIAKQSVVKSYNLEYALWALGFGLLVSNTVGCPDWLRPAVRTELYMKVGLVLLGAEVLLPKLLALGPPGVCIAWIVTPVVLCTTFWFGQRVLKIESPSLNMVISADMSVCGVSAAIATAAACKAKKEELSLAIGMSLSFTVLMMIVMPPLIAWMDLGQIVGGAWIGGTIDSTGAVGVAGAMLGEQALFVATTIKMIQNVLIGFVAFAVATYWVTRVERSADPDNRPGLDEIWRRFPKFILGFLGASLLFSAVHVLMPQGEEVVAATITGATKTLRGWCFCLAFVSIGLESDFRTLGKYLKGGKPLVLYVCGQSLNLCLTLAMSYAVFHWLFPGAADALTGP